MDDLGRILLFQDVVQSGGFSHAAARHGISHSTVSKQIRSLETELGTRLLNRTSRSMSLTEAGKVVLACSAQIEETANELRDRLDALRGEVVGELRIHSLLHVGKHLVQPAVASFLQEYPRVRPRLVLDDGPLHFNRDGFDLSVRVGLLAEGSLIASKLLDNDVCIVATPDFLERHGRPRSVEDLEELPAVTYQSVQYDISDWPYRVAGEVKSIRARSVCTASDGNALLDLIVSGAGCGYVSRFAASGFLESGRLERILPELELPAFAPVYVLRAPTEHVSPKIEGFVRHLRAVAETPTS